jgi:hypothetical protein
MALEKDITTSINNCKHLYLAMEKVIERCHLFPLGDMGSPRPMAYILNELEDNIKNKGSVIWMTPKFTKEVLKGHIVGPSKEINLINLFLKFLKKRKVSHA